MGRGTYPGCPWHFKVGQLGYRGLLYGVFDRFLGSVWVPPMGPFRLDMGGYAQDTCGGLVPTPRGCPWQLTCPSTPHPDGPPGLYRHVLVDFDVCTTGPKMVSRSPNLRPMWPQHPPKGIRWLVWAFPTYPGCPWHFKVGQLGYRGLLYGVFDRFWGSVWVPPWDLFG